MSKKLYFVCFLSGLALGAICTSGYFRDKYANKNSDEDEERSAAVAEAKILTEEGKTNKEAAEALGMKDEQNVRAKEDNKIEIDVEPDEIPERMPIQKLIKKTKTYSEQHKPYIIPPYEYGGVYEYDQVSLVYYADGVLVDENQDVVDDIEGCIGRESLEHFGEYEEDAVHVRNDDRKCDYEVLLDVRDWEDVKEL